MGACRTERGIKIYAPHVDADRVYFCMENGTVVALSKETGEEVWRHEQPFRTIDTPAGDAKRVFIGTRGGLIALSKASGELAWNHPLGQWGDERAPLVARGRVLYADYAGKVYGLSAESGEVLWESEILSDIPPEPEGFSGERARFQDIKARPGDSVTDGRLFVLAVFDQSRVAAFDCGTGEKRWSYETGGWADTTPTLTGDAVYVSAQSGPARQRLRRTAAPARLCLNAKRGRGIEAEPRLAGSGQEALPSPLHAGLIRRLGRWFRTVTS